MLAALLSPGCQTSVHAARAAAAAAPWLCSLLVNSHWRSVTTLTRRQTGPALSSCPVAAATYQQLRLASSGKGQIPKEGPARENLVAVPFAVSRAQADAAFKKFHSRHWLQNPSLPRWSGTKAAKEVFAPFWVGESNIAVEVQSAELGRDELVRELNRRTGRYETRLKTVWQRVNLRGLGWQVHHAPEAPEMQLYASWKYPRSDVEALRPGPLISTARAITPDMLQANQGAPSDTRRVGAFEIPPDVARRMLKSRVESAERRRAEEQVARATGHRHVRCIELTVKWLGPATGEGPRLSPVYVPLYVFSWVHGGIKVRTFVSGADSRASGPHYLDDTKVAVLATGATMAALLLSGTAALMSMTQLFVSGVVVPFVAAGLLARFWPAVRHLAQSGWGRLLQAWHSRRATGDTDWSADFVGAYSHQQQQQQQRGSQQRGAWGGKDRESFEEFIKDPFGWVERELRRQQQRAQQQRQQTSRGGEQQWYEEGDQYYEQQRVQQQRQQQQWQRERWQPRGAGLGGDPLGYYSRLGVKTNCSKEELSEAFRGLALKYHPDRYSGDKEKADATKRFQEITEAYQVLRDPSRRTQYDTTGRA